VVDRLDQNTFPYIKDAPHSTRSSNASVASSTAPASLRSSRPQWAERAKTRTVKEPKQRLVIFQLGGMTYSEIRSVYQVASASNRDVFIGSSHITTPKTFLQDLGDLDKGGAASMHDSLAPDAARYDKYRETNKNDKTPRLQPQDGFDRRFPFVSSRPPQQPGSAAPQTNTPGGNPGPPQQQQPAQQAQQQRPSGGVLSMPMPRPAEVQRQNSIRGLLHPNRPQAQQSQSYDANFNPITPASSAGSRAPSIASAASSKAAPEIGKPEKEKKKKNLLKKMF
jgi:syntaxin-binding protein 1